MKRERVGQAGFSISLNVYADEMCEWAPERIVRFFDGMAQMILSMREADDSKDIKGAPVEQPAIPATLGEPFTRPAFQLELDDDA